MYLFCPVAPTIEHYLYIADFNSILYIFLTGYMNCNSFQSFLQIPQSAFIYSPNSPTTSIEDESSQANTIEDQPDDIEIKRKNRQSYPGIRRTEDSPEQSPVSL